MKLLEPALWTGAGAVLGVVAHFVLGSRKGRLDHFQLLFERIEKDNERIEKENEKLRERERELSGRLDDFRDRLDEMSKKLKVMETAHFDLPLPQWIKDTNGVILSINTQCEEIFIKPAGLSRLDCIGAHDRDLFEKKTAEQIERNDAKAKRKRKPIQSVEELTIAGEKQRWIVMRYPIMYDGVVIAIGGVAFRQLQEEDFIKLT